MSADRASRGRRARRRQESPEVAPEIAPEIVVTEMEEATQRLRDQAWKINATTKTPLISERALTRETEPSRGDSGR